MWPGVSQRGGSQEKAGSFQNKGAGRCARGTRTQSSRVVLAAETLETGWIKMQGGRF